MNRRDFMRRMFGLTVTIAVNPTIFIPQPSSLYGIDYGLNDGTVGTWMGITRDMKPAFRPWLYGGARGGGKAITQEMIKLIRKMMDDALDKHWEIIIANEAQVDAYNKLKKLS